ncbi:hypothetical protein RHOSPDRAFT_23902 [Rhodotorula sp. JG-1b]|nr:hypothetical protein RHOSPDRAFT_23902 [Rhodotorula sp. JG-1b]
MSARLGPLFVSNDQDDHDHVVELRGFVLHELGQIKDALERRESNPRGSGIPPEGWIAQVLVRNDPYALQLDFEERYRARLPLFHLDIELPGSESTLDQCRHDFRSLLFEISSLNVHNGPVSELDPNDDFRRLFEALQGWRVSMVTIFWQLFEPARAVPTNRRHLATARQLNKFLTLLLDHMWAMARSEGVDQAMRWVIRAPRRPRKHSSYNYCLIRKLVATTKQTPAGTNASASSSRRTLSGLSLNEFGTSARAKGLVRPPSDKPSRAFREHAGSHATDFLLLHKWSGLLWAESTTVSVLRLGLAVYVASDSDGGPSRLPVWVRSLTRIVSRGTPTKLLSCRSLTDSTSWEKSLSSRRDLMSTSGSGVESVRWRSSCLSTLYARGKLKRSTRLHSGANGWHVVMGVQYGHLVEDDNRLSTAQVMLKTLTELLYSMYAMAVAEECGIGPPMLMIIVRLELGHAFKRKILSNSRFKRKVLTLRFCGNGAQDTSPAEVAKRLCLSPVIQLPVALAKIDNVSMYLEVTSPDAEALHGWIEGYRDLYEKFQDSQLKACTALPGYTGSNTTQQHEWNSV